MKTRYGTLATLTLAFAASVATLRLAAETYYWIGSSGGDWASGDNWSLSEGGAAANTVPTGTDDVIFTDDATADISAGDVSVNNFTIQSGKRVCIKDESQTKKLAMGYSLSEVGTTLALAGATVLPQANSTSDTLNIYSGVEFVEGYTSGVYANSQRVDGNNKPARYVALRGPLSGKGTLKFINNNATSRSRIYFYGDNSNFEGSVNIGGSNSNGATWSAAESGSAKAKWQVAQTDNSSLTFGFTSGTIAFGSLETTGRITLAASSIISVQLGMDGDDSECGAQFVRGSSGGNPSFVKVGNNKVTYTGTFPADNNNYGTITLLKGTWAHGTTSLPKQGFKFTGGMLAIPAGVSIDPSAYIKNSTAAIIFDDEGTSRTWATALAESNGGGLEKKGSGTLTLSAVPLYTGTTTVSEGALVIPGGTTLAKLSVADGATLYVSGTDGQTITITEFADGTTTDNVKAVAGSSLSWNGNTATISRSAATYTWTDATGDHNWATPGNWTINSEVATIPPMTIDTVLFNTANASVTLSSGATVAEIIVDSPTTFSIPDNLPLRSPMVRGEGVITVAEGFFAPLNNGTSSASAICVISNDIVFAEGYDGAAYLAGADYQAIYLRGDISGSGKLTITEGSKRDVGIRFYGSSEGFSGSILVSCSNQYRRDQTKFFTTNAVNANVAYAFWGNDKNNDTFEAAEGESVRYWRLGSVDGCIYMKTSKADGHTFEVGSLNTDFECGGTIGHKSNSGEWSYLNTVRKVGSGTFTSSINYAGTYEIAGGNLLLATNALPITALKFEGGTLVLTNAFKETELDIAAKIKGSSSAISIDTNGDEFEFSSSLDSSNVGGLTKLGAGTLTLSVAPLYTGLTTVEEGALIVPQGTKLSYNALSDTNLVSGATITNYAYEANTALTAPKTSGSVVYDAPLDIANIVSIDASAATLTPGQPFVIASATAITGYTKAGLAELPLTLPDGADESKWMLKVMTVGNARCLCVAPKGGFLLVIQ